MIVRELLKIIDIDSDDNRLINNIVFDISKLTRNDVLLIMNNKCKEMYDKLVINKPILIISCIKDDRFIFVENLKEKISLIFIKFYNIDFSKIKLIAITGTEMKSSLAKLLFDSLIIANKKVKLISSHFEDENIYNSSLTTPQSNDILNFIKQSIDENIEYFIYEASSIGINECRLNNIIPNYIFLTNLKEDHLDYHGSLDNYYFAKEKYINTSKRIIGKSEELKKINITIKKHIIKKYFINGNELIYNDKKYSFKYLCNIQLDIIPYILEFFSLEKINIDFSILKYPNGRLEILKKEPIVMLDYAHSPFAFEKVCKYFSFLVKGKKIIVFGAGGEREKEKRNIYGNIALKYFDYRIVTEDNSRNEDLDNIINDIIGDKKEKFIVIKKRKNAIEYAFSLLNNINDGILFVGKGNEKYINTQNKLIPYSEREEILKYL